MKITLLFIFITSLGFSQTYPAKTLLDSIPQEVYSNPTGALPGYLVPDTLTDSRYLGHILTRVSDKVVFGVNTQQLGNNYSKDQAWNSDGTLLKLSGYPAAILDGNTYQFLYWTNIPGYGRWSNTQPNIIYGTSGNTFQSHNVLTNTRTTLHTFSSFSSVDFGFGEGNQSNDDRYVGLIGENGSDRTLIVYDILNDVIVGTKFLGSTGDLDWFTVSPSGNYAVVQWRDNGSGATEGNKSYALDFTNEVHVYDETQHADLGFDSFGNEVIVGFGNNNTWGTDHYLFMARLSDGYYTPLFYWESGVPASRTHSGIWGGHISLRATNRPGWAYVSEGCCSGHPTLPNEIFAIKLDGSDSIERYCNSNNDPTVGYGHEVHNAVNRDGTKIVFKSNWRDAGWKGDVSPPAWVVEVPQTSSNPPIANAGNDTTICLGDSIQLIATGVGSYLWSTGDTTANIWINPSIVTNYIVTVTDTSGSDKDTIVVTPDSNLCNQAICFNNYIIVIDGVEEIFWTNSFEDSMSKIIEGVVTNNSDLSASFKLMWDNNNLYIIAEITDDIKTNDSPNEWEDDGIEIFIDGNNDKTVAYDANDRQYIIRWNDNTVYEHGFNSGTNPVGVVFAQTNTATGYIIEGKIAWSSIGVSPSSGKDIGFEIQVNDDDNGGTSLEARKSWYALSSPSPDASLMGVVELSTGVCNNTTGIENKTNSDISIYPNPSSDYFVIEGVFDPVSVVVYDSEGRKVLEKLNVESGEKTNILRLKRGVYIVEIIKGNQKINYRLIKK